MFRAVAEHLSELDNGGLDTRIRDIELQQRALEAERAAAVAEAERRGLHTRDGHRSMKAYLRATCNVSSGEATRRRRLGRLVSTVPGAGQRLHDGRIGVRQVDDLARARANPRCGDRLEEVAPLLLDHAELLSYDDFRICVKRRETSGAIPRPVALGAATTTLTTRCPGLRRNAASTPRSTCSAAPGTAPTSRRWK